MEPYANNECCCYLAQAVILAPVKQSVLVGLEGDIAFALSTKNTPQEPRGDWLRPFKKNTQAR